MKREGGKDKLIVATLSEYAPVEELSEYLGCRESDKDENEAEIEENE
ncbi:MAG: hypothetical protein ACI4LK_06515 [Lentihominibacter sp.]